MIVIVISYSVSHKMSHFVLTLLNVLKSMFKILLLLEREEHLQQKVQKCPSHFKCVPTLPCEMQTFEDDTNCAVLRRFVIISQMFNQLLTLSQNLLEIISFDLQTTSSQIRVPLVNCQESCSSFSRIVLSHTEPASLSGFWSRYTHKFMSSNQTAPTSTHWTTLSVASTNSMSTSPVCSRCQ